MGCRPISDTFYSASPGDRQWRKVIVSGRSFRDIRQIADGFLDELTLISGFESWSLFLNESILAMGELYKEYMGLIPPSIRCLNSKYRRNAAYRSFIKTSENSVLSDFVFLPWRHLLFHAGTIYKLSRMNRVLPEEGTAN